MTMILVGDCREVMATLDAASVDAVVTDPPYELGFMGKGWDKAGVAFDPATWAEVLRVLKPGGHLLSFGGTRTFHRMTVAIEDAGFEIRDTLAWMYATGFPKSLNVGDGRGTALKPAYEPIVLARKPLIGTVAANVLAHGTGALNIDACRLSTTDSLGGGDQSSRTKVKPDGWDRPWMHDEAAKAAHAERVNANVAKAESLGRWPANVCLDETAAALLDEQSGERGGGFATRGASSRIYGGGKGFTENTGETVGYGDTGGASRFFFVARNEVQYDLNSQAERGDDWADQDHRQSIQADSATPPQRAITASTSGTRLPEKDAPSWPTSSNGSGITARSLTATRSITETATSKTTPSPTSNSLTPSRTSDCIPAANCEPERGGSHAAPVASSSQSTPSIGISALKDGRSTDDAAPAISARSLPISKGGVRFAYVPKASRRERNLGLPDGESSNHPTVKPVALMRWLVKLVTPPDGLVLDPFTGSGSTGVACAHEGFRFLGIEQSDEYAEIARRRIAAVNPLFAMAAD